MNYRFNEEKMFMDITDGTALIINSETGMYYGINRFGTSVFQALCDGMNTGAIIAAAKALPGAPADIVERCNGFISLLVEYELLVNGSEGPETGLDAEAAAEDTFILDITEFDDAQEMLMADPIHEVKEDTGWTPEKDSIGYSKEETREREKKVQ